MLELRLIGNDRDYAAVLSEIKRLWSARSGSAERDRLEILAMLAQRYQREREPLPELAPVDAIKFRMEQQGLTRKDLLGIFGTTARVSEVLNGKRALTLEMIRRLHSDLGIPLESLVGPSRVRASRKRRAPSVKRKGRAA